METKYKNVYVTLNSLIDIRLTLAVYANPNILTNYDGGFLQRYLNRRRDNIESVPYTIIEDLYNTYVNNDMLKVCMPTSLLHDVIVEDFRALQINVYKETKIELNNKLIINTYPFTLSDDSKEYFQIMASEILPDVELELVRLSIAEVTPKWLIENNIVSFYDYYGSDWLAYHTNLGDIMDDDRIRDISFVFPKIENSMIPMENLTDGFFIESETMIKNMLNLIHISAYFFSASFGDFYLQDKINEIRDSDIQVNIAKEEEIIKERGERKDERDTKPTDRTANISKW